MTVAVAGALTVFALAAAAPCLDRARRYDTAWWGLSPADTTLLHVMATEYTSNPSGGGVGQELSRAVLAAGEGTTVLQDSAGEGPPAIGVYQAESAPLPGLDVAGRWFSRKEMASAEPVILVRHGSYLVRHAADSAAPWPGPMPAGEVIGTFRGPGRGAEYLVPLFSLGQVTGDYYLRSRDPSLAGRVANLLAASGYAVHVEKPPTRFAFATDGPLVAPLAGLLVVGLITLALVVAGQASARRDRAAVHTLLGATRSDLARRLALDWGLAAAGGVGIGSLMALGLIALVDPELVRGVAHPAVSAVWLVLVCLTSVAAASAATLSGLWSGRRGS